MKVSIIVPCHNEERTVGIILKKLHELNLSKQIILVNDGSTDKTPEILTQYKDFIDDLVTMPTNQGKGAAVREGLKYVTGDIVIIQDADLEYDVSFIPAIVNPIINGSADVVYGSRFLNTGNRGNPINYIANKIFTWAYAKRTGWVMTDVYTCQKAALTNLVKNISLEENKFGFDIEITTKLAKLSKRYKEIPVDYKPRTKKEGKHIGLSDGLRGLTMLFID